MDYLARVLHTLKKSTWEKWSVATKHAIYVLLAATCVSMCYWLIDLAINTLIRQF